MHSLFLPLTIAKFFDYYKSKNANLINNKNPNEKIEFKYTKKMLPKPNYIKNYFE
jgi:hypothetical protein